MKPVMHDRIDEGIEEKSGIEHGDVLLGDGLNVRAASFRKLAANHLGELARQGPAQEVAIHAVGPKTQVSQMWFHDDCLLF